MAVKDHRQVEGSLFFLRPKTRDCVLRQFHLVYTQDLFGRIRVVKVSSTDTSVEGYTVRKDGTLCQGFWLSHAWSELGPTDKRLTLLSIGVQKLRLRLRFIQASALGRGGNMFLDHG